MTPHYRIGVVGTKGAGRRYITGTADEIELGGRIDALHWDKRVAKILTRAFNEQFSREGRPEVLQIEQAG